MEKMTKKEMYEELIAVCKGEKEFSDELKKIVIEDAETRIKTLENKQSKLAEKRDAISKEITERILAIVSAKEEYTLNELVEIYTETYNDSITTQRIASRLKGAVADGIVVKGKNSDKKVTYQLAVDNTVKEEVSE